MVCLLQVDDSDDPIGLPQMWDTTDGGSTAQGGDRHQVTVTGLQPDNFYQFQVAAYTRKGDGLRSRPKKAKTKGAGTCSSHVYLYIE